MLEKRKLADHDFSKDHLSQRPIIKLTGVSFDFGERVALSNISIEMADFGLFGIISDSLLTQATLVDLMCGYTESSSGEVEILGYSAFKGRRYARKGIGLACHRYILNGTLFLRDTLLAFARIRGLDKVSSLEKIESLAARFGISGYLDYRIENLAKSTRIKATILAELLHDPVILMMDSLLELLNYEDRQEVMMVLEDYKKKSLVVVLTDKPGITNIVDHFFIFHCGRLIASMDKSQYIGEKGNLTDDEIYSLIVNRFKEESY